MGRGIPKTPRAGRRRRWSYRSLERILPFLGQSLGSRAVWRINLVDEKLGIATAMIVFEAPPPGYAVLCSVGVGAAVFPVAWRCGSRVIASVVVIDAIKKCAGMPKGR